MDYLTKEEQKEQEMNWEKTDYKEHYQNAELQTQSAWANSYVVRHCDQCGKEYKADKRNLKRGWGLCCSKSCAAKKREMDRPGYNAERVRLNNVKREIWNFRFPDDNTKKAPWHESGLDDGDSEYWDNKDFL